MDHSPPLIFSSASAMPWPLPMDKVTTPPLDAVAAHRVDQPRGWNGVPIAVHKGAIRTTKWRDITDHFFRSGAAGAPRLQESVTAPWGNVHCGKPPKPAVRAGRYEPVGYISSENRWTKVP
jgi:hypothetical protein